MGRRRKLSGETYDDLPVELYEDASDYDILDPCHEESGPSRYDILASDYDEDDD